MYELIQVSENTYYIQSPAKIGIVKHIMKREIDKKEVCEKLQKRILRIQEMEQYYDEVLRAVNICPDAAVEDDAIRKKVQMLEEYCTGGQWLQDYECDERGELPADLKRGVLSQDGLYNLLCDIWN